MGRSLGEDMKKGRKHLVDALEKKVVKMTADEVDLDDFQVLFDKTSKDVLGLYKRRLYNQEEELEQQIEEIEEQRDWNEFYQKLIHAYYDWKKAVKEKE
jgi:hypothetical protein